MRNAWDNSWRVEELGLSTNRNYVFGGIYSLYSVTATQDKDQPFHPNQLKHLQKQ